MIVIYTLILWATHLRTLFLFSIFTILSCRYCSHHNLCCFVFIDKTYVQFLFFDNLHTNLCLLFNTVPGYVDFYIIYYSEYFSIMLTVLFAPISTSTLSITDDSIIGLHSISTIEFVLLNFLNFSLIENHTNIVSP